MTLAICAICLGVVAGPAGGDDPRPAAEAPKAKEKAKAKRAPVMTPGGKWKRGDMARPRPRVVDPGPAPAGPAPVPDDAVVLFGGKEPNLDAWENRVKGQAVAAAWKVADGWFEAVPKSGTLYAKSALKGGHQIHVEWASPSVVQGKGQGRGNSGLLLGGVGEVQILDSVDNDTYPDGQNAAVYGQYPPRVNASRKPGEWQTFDVFLETAREAGEGESQASPARLTLVHNGVPVHLAVELPAARAGEFTLALQDHNNPVRFRNIWVRPLTGYDEGGTAPPPPLTTTTGVK